MEHESDDPDDDGLDGIGSGSNGWFAHTITIHQHLESFDAVRRECALHRLHGEMVGLLGSVNV